MSNVHDVIRADLDAILERKPTLWDDLRGASVFMTGGTGWFGRWLLESIRHANAQLGTAIRVTVLSRAPSALAKTAPHLVADPAIRFHIGDVRDFDFPCGVFSHVIHAATTSARETYEGASPLSKFDTLVAGTRHVLDFSLWAGVDRFLFLSSGSAYGVTGLDRIPETYTCAPDTMNSDSALGEAKRAAELLMTCYAQEYGLKCTAARCFSFVGPFMPLTIHYAIGNFIRDALWRDMITVQGDGTSLRSYLYLADTVVWLLTLLGSGRPNQLYNVGSDQGISIHDLAEMVRLVVAPDKPVILLSQGNGSVGNENRSRYVPDITRAREELGLDVWTSLETAIGLTTANALHLGQI